MIFTPVLFLTCVGATALLFLGVDFLVHFGRWQGRICIGRWDDLESWIAALADVSARWLLKSPTVKITDNNRLLLWDMLIGKYKNEGVQSWQDAGLLLGLAAYSKKDAFGKAGRSIERFIERKIDLNTGRWKTPPPQIDATLLGYAFLQQTAVPVTRLKPAFDYLADLIFRMKGEKETIPYNMKLPDIRFVDTIGLVAPFLSAYGVFFNRTDCVRLAMAQIKGYDKAILPGHVIPAHAFDLTSELPLGIFGWGRGFGWYALGMIDVYLSLPETFRGERAILEGRICSAANELIRYQSEDGGVGTMLGVSGSYDSSATALAGWLFYYAYRINSQMRFLEAAKKTLQRLMKSTRRSGMIDFNQGDTKGIGYYSNTSDLMPFTQGIALRLALVVQTGNSL